MKKTLKLFSILAMVVVMLSTSASMVFAVEKDKDGNPIITKPTDIVDSINPTISDAGAATGLIGIANQVIGLIQIASAVAAVILVAVFGFKFILGSANEKADYQKSFIPLIVGVVVVFAATSIAKLLFGLIG